MWLLTLPSEEEDAQEVKQVIEDAGQKGILIPGDLRDEQFNYDMVETAYNELGGLDNVTLVAGHQQYHDDIHGFNTEAFAETFETNVYPVFWTVQKALEYLKPGSSITTTSSVQGYNPSPILHDYAASKAAIISLTKSFSEELGAKGIRVNCVAPGPFWSPLQITGGQPQSALHLDNKRHWVVPVNQLNYQVLTFYLLQKIQVILLAKSLV